MEGMEEGNRPGLGALRDMGSESIARAIERIEKWSSTGHKADRTLERIVSITDSKDAADILFDIARTRRSAGGKFRNGKRLFFTSQGLRWATPETAADHCARRMAGPSSADITCGQGGQVFSLARCCDRVTAIELDPLNAFIANLNFTELGLDNVSLHNGNCLDRELVDSIEPGSYVFSDPARPEGSRERSLDEIEPDPRRVIAAYRERASGFCFEVPPYMSLDRIDFPCEAEYVSIDGRLNRLNLYAGNLARGATSVAVLPGGYSITGRPQPPPCSDENDAEGGYSQEIDPAMIASGLLRQAMEEARADLKVVCLDERRTLSLSDEPLDLGFLGPAFRVLSICGIEDLKAELKACGAGKVTLRYKVDPGDYWAQRLGIESELEGAKKVHLFKGKRYYILEPIEDRFIR